MWKVVSRDKGEKAWLQSLLITHEALIFGISRMYELQSSNEAMDVIVLQSIDELPEEIRTKLPGYKQRNDPI